MPSPLPRLLTQSQKPVLIIGIIGLALLIFTTVIISYHRHQTAVSRINYTQLFTLSAQSTA